MIHIKKSEAPAWLTTADSKWETETAKAIEHYAVAGVKAFEFDAYNDSRLKDELKKVFSKCAYCETDYANSSDGDIEHFRPKGRVTEKKPQTPGYYWLANDWENLLLSCQHCNQKRNHQIQDGNAAGNYGKSDQFPLRDESKRISLHNLSLDEEEQYRLLINPCIESPELHFTYEKTEAVILSDTDMGKKSIEVYALRRPYLVQARKKKMILLSIQMSRVLKELERLDNDKSDAQQQIFDQELGYLLQYGKPEAEYAGMSRFFIRNFLKENNLKA